MQIIKDDEIIKDHWQHIADDPIPQDGCITISAARWKNEKKGLLSRDGELGLRISPQDTIEDFSGDLQHFQLIGLEFPNFTDGRLFSVARLLRGQYHYSGEIRAMGNFIRDQIYFLSRVGVNSFEFNEQTDLAEALSGLTEFTVNYQASSNNE